MKRFENIFRTFFALLAVFAATAAKAQLLPAAEERGRAALPSDSVEIGLLTCSPHDEIYSLYGHSGLHYNNLTTGEQRVYNYGVFEADRPHFVWHFMMGETDYRLERIYSLSAWLRYYAMWGCQVEEQVLALTHEEKVRLVDALDENVEKYPVYRYNFFFDNCATRPRDIIERCVDGQVVYPAHDDATAPTFREIVHQQTEGYPWAAFGNDLLLGLRADMRTTARERHFLPANLSSDVAGAYVVRSGGVRTPLVARHEVLVAKGEPSLEADMPDFPLRPRACTLLLFIVSALVAAYEYRRKRAVVLWDAALMLLTGIAGCILALMFFSEHPATSTNLQVLVLNPLSLVFLNPVLHRRPTVWFRLSLVCIAAFLVGGFWQDYAEGMYFVALSLLIRCWTHRHDK